MVLSLKQCTRTRYTKGHVYLGASRVAMVFDLQKGKPPPPAVAETCVCIFMVGPARRGGWKEAKAGSAAGFAIQGLSPLEMLCCHPSDQWLPSAPPNQVKTKP